MKSQVIWLVHSSSIYKVKAKLRGIEFEWCYLGTREPLLRRLFALFGREKEVEFGNELNQIALKLKSHFLDWMCQLSIMQKNTISWWSSTFATHSPLQSDLFLFVCYLQLIRTWLHKNINKTLIRVIVVDDVWLFRSIKKEIGKNDEVEIFNGRYFLNVFNKVYWLIRAPLVRIWLLFKGIELMWNGKGSLQNYYQMQLKSIPRYLVFSWIDERCFKDSLKFHDPYFGRLPEVLKDSDIQLTYFTPLELSRQDLDKVKKKSHFIVTSSFLKFTDIIRVCLSRRVFQGLKGRQSLQGIDCSDLLKRELKYEKGRPTQFLTLLWYYTVIRLIKLYDKTINVIIYPFENQAWEKMLCLAVRKGNQDIKLIGYQHTSIPPLLLNYYYGKDGGKYYPLPDVIVANGEYNQRSMAKYFEPKCKVLNGGALRHEFLYFLKSQKKLENKRKTVLVAFPNSLFDSKLFFLDLFEGFKDCLDISGESVLLLLKFHPKVSTETILASINSKLPEWIEISDEPIHDSMKKTDLFLYMPPTTTWKEAYFLGIPVLKYQTNLLDIDAQISHEDPFEVDYCSRKNLRDSIKKVLLKKKTDNRAISSEVLEKTFGKVDEKFWIQLISQE